MVGVGVDMKFTMKQVLHTNKIQAEEIAALKSRASSLEGRLEAAMKMETKSREDLCTGCSNGMTYCDCPEDEGPKPCVDPSKMKGAEDGFGGSDY